MGACVGCVDGGDCASGLCTDQICEASVGLVNPGGVRQWADGTFAPTCLAYRQPANPHVYAGSTGDGLYRLTGSVDVYCDMTTDGGGWTFLSHFRHPTTENAPPDLDNRDYAYFMMARSDVTRGLPQYLADPNSSGTWSDWRVLANTTWPIEFVMLLDIPSFSSGWENYDRKVIYRVKTRNIMPNYGTSQDLATGDNLWYKFTPGAGWTDVGSSSGSSFYYWYPLTSTNAYLSLMHEGNYRYVNNSTPTNNQYICYFGSGMPSGDNTWYHSVHMLVR